MPRREKIRQLLKAVSKKPESTPGDEESLFEAGVLDSFALTDLVAELEQAFGIQVPDSDLSPRKFDSVARIEQYLESRGA